MKKLERRIKKLEEKAPPLEPITIIRVIVDMDGNEVDRIVRTYDTQKIEK